MADRQPTCPKCSRDMERGHVPDASHSQVFQTRWSRGEPVQRKLVGGIKWERDEQIPMTAYRCTSCGFVEFYARPTA